MSEEIENVNVAEKCEEQDDGLDSFFKKKDKKGKKKKSKKADAGSSDKESAASKPKKKEADLKKDSDNLAEGSSSKQEQEEWIDFEDESQRDYSDLKIQNLQIVNDGSDQPPVEEPSYNEAGELIPPKPAEGPWKNVATKQKEHAPPVVEVSQPEPPKKTGAYRPPQARAAAAGNHLPSALPKRSGRRQQVPEIHNEFDFPSLANAVQDVVPVPKGFEEVKHGSKSSAWQDLQAKKAKASEIRLENQFAAFSTNN